MLDNMHKIDLSAYGMNMESIQTEVNSYGNVPEGVGDSLSYAKVTMVMGIQFLALSDTTNKEEGFNNLMLDLQILSKAKKSEHPGVKEQYEKLLTIMALNGDVS